MPVLVFVENWEGKFKKPSFEVMTYSYELAKKLNDTVTALVIGNVAEKELKKAGDYGCSKILYFQDSKSPALCPAAHTAVAAAAAANENARIIIFSYTYSGKALAPRLSAKLQAGMVTGAVGLPSQTEPFTVKKKCFSGKGFADAIITSETKIVAIFPNSHHIQSNSVAITIETYNLEVPDNLYNTTIKEVKKTSGKVVLTEADIVVSGGRGMKGPENWGMLEKLAEALGAATACSKPVADMGWRPHHEHVGQTGITISPNLYIAIGISGAIQHLAGISSSKVIVAINADKDAPIFKIADYGIAGDAFAVIPKITDSVNQLKDSH